MSEPLTFDELVVGRTYLVKSAKGGTSVTWTLRKKESIVVVSYLENGIPQERYVVEFYGIQGHFHMSDILIYKL